MRADTTRTADTVLESESVSELEVAEEAATTSTASDKLPSGLKVDPHKVEILTREMQRIRARQHAR